MFFHLFVSIVLGAIFGSFSTFLGFRIFNENKEINLTGKRSICCNCKHVLNFFDLIPILSFICLRGKCRYCKKPIPIWHFLAEIFMVCSFVFATLYTKDINKQTTLIWLICFCLITQSIIDYRTMMSSDIIHFITFISSIFLSYLIGYSKYQIIITPIVILFIFILLSYIMKKILKKDCIGFGDVKLFVALSPLLTIEKLPIFFGLSGFFGILFYFLLIFYYKNKQQNNDKINDKTKEINSFPFIPSIFFAFLLAFYF